MPSKKTFLRINNHTSSPFVIRVQNVDSYDWDNKVGPLSFNGKIVQPKDNVQGRLEINSFATANLYTLILCFDQNTVVCFRIDQGIAAGRKASFNDYIPSAVRSLASLNYKALIGLELATSAANIIHSCVVHKERGVFNVSGNAAVKVDDRIEGETLVIDVRPM